MNFAREMKTNKSVVSQDVLLNLVRVAAAFSIAIWHFQLLIPTGNLTQITVDDYPFQVFLRFLYTHGFLAVQLFWVISGFVIAKAYLNRTWEPSRFIRNRFARLYPLHVVTLLIVAILQIAIRKSQGNYAICVYQDLYHFFLNLFFIPAIGLEKGCSFNAPIWSVSVELISYTAFAILLTFGGKIKFFKLIVLNVITLILLVLNPVNLPTHILECGFFFFCGTSLFWIRSIESKFPSYILLFIPLLIFLKTEKIQIGNFNLKESSIPWALAFGTILVLQDWANKRFVGLIHLRTISETLGNLTYSSYLLQYPLILCWLLFCSYFKIVLKPIYLPYLMIGYIVILFGLSHLTFQKFEDYWRERLRK